MKRAIPALFIGVAILAVASVVYAVGRGALGTAHPATMEARASAEAPAAVTPPAPITVDELHAVGLSRVKDGTKILDFELENLKGGRTRLSDLGGSVVFLNFWATWCPPCRAEMPSMERLQAKLNDKDFRILAVDLQEGDQAVQAFMRDHKLTLPVVLDRDGSAGATYGVRSIPTTYIIDRKGMIIAGRIGGQEWDSPAHVAFFRKLLAQ